MKATQGAVPGPAFEPIQLQGEHRSAFADLRQEAERIAAAARELSARRDAVSAATETLRLRVLMSAGFTTHEGWVFDVSAEGEPRLVRTGE